MLLLIFLCILLLLSGCSERADSHSTAIYAAGTLKVYADSIIRDGRRLTLPHPEADAEKAVPQLGGTWGVLDTLFNASVACVRPESLTPLHTLLYGGMLFPSESAQGLRSRVKKGMVFEPRFPEEATSPGWAAAAAEVYLWGRSEKWLRDSYNITLATWRRWRSLDPLPAPVLFSAADSTLSGVYPSWMSRAERIQTVSLRSNLLRQIDLAASAMMASRLALYAERELQTEARELRNAINDRFWTPQLGLYGRYLYGSFYKVLSNPADVGANALAVIADVATPEMGSYIISGIPMQPEGYGGFYPAASASDGVSPEATALMSLAAARVRDGRVFSRSLAALLAAAASSPGRPTLLPAVVLRGLFGISATPECVSFAPFVPAGMSGDKRLTAFRIGDALFDIRLRGTGHRMASFMIDSVAAEPRVKFGLTGRHSIDIVLANNDRTEELGNTGNRADGNPSPDAILPSAPSASRSGNMLTVRQTGGQGSTPYAVWINGVHAFTSDAPQLQLGHLSSTGTTVIDVASLTSRVFTSLPARPVLIAPQGAVLQVPATSITPRRAPVNLIPDLNTARQFIELAPRHNTRLTFWVNAPAEGTYSLCLVGSNGFNEAAVRRVGRVEADGRADSYLGTLVSPSTGPGNWTAAAPSTTLDIRLAEGPNHLSLLYVQGTVLMKNIILYRK